MYEYLFREGKIGGLTLPNRVVMTGMATMLADCNGNATAATVRYYEERAKGGIGLIISEYTYVDAETGVATPNQLAATSVYNALSFQKISRAIHRYGGKFFVQLCHPGLKAFGLLLKKGLTPVGVCDGATPEGICVHGLTTEEVQALRDRFITGAMYAQYGEADGVEIHAAHSYLLSNFLSPHMNHRQDQYGGSPENRARFICEIIAGIKRTCGKGFPVCVRINGCDFIEGGVTPADAAITARLLEAAGADALNVSNSTIGSYKAVIEPVFYEQGWKKELAKTVKQAVRIPVIAVNTIKQPDFAEKLLADGVCDFVGLARQSLADPFWCHKAQAGREDEIRPCISCLHCLESEGKLRSITCAVNPRTGRESELEDVPRQNGAGRVVAILGGGPAGMEAGQVLARRGFKPILLERSDHLGGNAYLAGKPPLKEKILRLVESMERETLRCGVEVRLNTEPDVEMLRELNPYAIFISTGAEPIVPKSLPGITSPHVYTVNQILDSTVELQGKNIVVVGGGLTGLDVAEYLAENNCVQVIEMLDQIGTGVFAVNLTAELEQLALRKVTLHTGTKLLEIRQDDISVEHTVDGSVSELQADAVVLSLGVRPDAALLETLKKEFPQVKIMGSALKPLGRIADAVHTAFDCAYTLE